MAKHVYSFLDIAASIVGPGGALSIGAGAGIAEEGMDVETSADINTMMIGADGKGQHSLSADKSGRVTIRVLKTSPLNGQLMAMVNFQRSSGSTHGQNTIAITDLNRGDVITAQQCAFKKIPTITNGKEAGMNEWSFDSITIDYLLT